MKFRFWYPHKVLLAHSYVHTVLPVPAFALEGQCWERCNSSITLPTKHEVCAIWPYKNVKNSGLDSKAKKVGQCTSASQNTVKIEHA